MKNLALGLIVFAASLAHAELPLNSRDELTARLYVACADHAVTVRLESMSGRKELRVYREQNYRLASVEIVDLVSKEELRWKRADENSVGPVGFRSSSAYKPTRLAIEELNEEFEVFRAQCQIQSLLRDNPFNPKLQDLAVVMSTRRERARFYWH